MSLLIGFKNWNINYYKMVDKDIRWIQRFNNYKKALAKLTEAVEKNYETMSELEIEGLIQRFEYTYELAWNTLQDFLRIKGYPDIKGPTPVIEQALKDGYIKGDWKKLKKARESTSHDYDESQAEQIAIEITDIYHRMFIQLETRLELERKS
jgi:nucleotidyltransferase substrate binding protein (TIGR01987 family)